MRKWVLLFVTFTAINCSSTYPWLSDEALAKYQYRIDKVNIYMEPPMTEYKQGKPIVLDCYEISDFCACSWEDMYEALKVKSMLMVVK